MNIITTFCRSPLSLIAPFVDAASFDENERLVALN